MKKALTLIFNFQFWIWMLISLQAMAGDNEFVKSELTNKLNEILVNSADISPGNLLRVSGPGFRFSEANGLADKETRLPMNTKFSMRIGSITKLYVAALAVIAQNQNLLDFDAPITEHLPEWAKETLPTNSFIKVRHLLLHTSGLPDYYSLWFYLYGWDKSRIITSEFVLEQTKDKDLLGEPGEDHHYSNTNFHYLALVLESVFNMSLEAALEKHLFAPLNLSNTALNSQFNPEDKIHGYGAPIMPWGSPLFSWIDTYHWHENSGADGGIFTDLNDLDTFLRSIFSSGGQFQHVGNKMSQSRRQLSKRKFQGLGTDIRLSKSGETLLGHTGANDGYLTAAFYLPSSDFSFIFHMNSSNTEGFAATVGAIAKTIINSQNKNGQLNVKTLAE